MYLKKLVDFSVAYIKANVYNGLPVASPKGTRYWPHCYPRDAVMIAKSLDRVGENKLAEQIYNTLVMLIDRKGGIYQRYDVRTRKDTSYKKLQLDAPGLLLWGLVDHYKITENKTFLIRHFKAMKKLVKFVLSHKKKIHNKQLIYTCASIHEYPEVEKGFEIWSNVCCLAGLKAFNEVSIILKKKIIDIKHLEKDIISTFYKNGFVKTLRKNEVLKYPDISCISFFLFNLKSCKKFVNDIEKPIPFGLYDKELKGICRYPEYIGRHNGGFGPWVRDTAWLAAYKLMQRKYTQGKKYLKLCASFANKNLLLPEHVSTLERLRKYLQEQFLLNKDFSLMRYIYSDKRTMIKAVKNSHMTELRKSLVISELKQQGKILRAVPGLLQSHAEFLYAWSLCR